MQAENKHLSISLLGKEEKVVLECKQEQATTSYWALRGCPSFPDNQGGLNRKQWELSNTPPLWLKWVVLGAYRDDDAYPELI